MKEANRIIVFDGICNFCSGFVQFIIKRDPGMIFTFAPVQSDAGKEILGKYGYNPQEGETLLLIKENKLFVKSDAALEITKELKGLWKNLVILRILPRNTRDWFYSKIAKNRYKWFGKRERCFVPTDDIKRRFLN